MMVSLLLAKGSELNLLVSYPTMSTLSSKRARVAAAMGVIEGWKGSLVHLWSLLLLIFILSRLLGILAIVIVKAVDSAPTIGL